MNRSEALKDILQLARDVADDSDSFEETSHARSAIQYAMLKRLEESGERRLDYPVVVKYGDANAVRESYGHHDAVWGVPHPEGYILFRVMPLEQLHQEQVEKVRKQFQAIGAWYVGVTDCKATCEMHHHFLWPKDHAVVRLLDR